MSSDGDNATGGFVPADGGETSVEVTTDPTTETVETSWIEGASTEATPVETESTGSAETTEAGATIETTDPAPVESDAGATDQGVPTD